MLCLREVSMVLVAVLLASSIVVKSSPRIVVRGEIVKLQCGHNTCCVDDRLLLRSDEQLKWHLTQCWWFLALKCLLVLVARCWATLLRVVLLMSLLECDFGRADRGVFPARVEPPPAPPTEDWLKYWADSLLDYCNSRRFWWWWLWGCYDVVFVLSRLAIVCAWKLLYFIESVWFILFI